MADRPVTDDGFPPGFKWSDEEGRPVYIGLPNHTLSPITAPVTDYIAALARILASTPAVNELRNQSEIVRRQSGSSGSARSLSRKALAVLDLLDALAIPKGRLP